MSEEQRLGVLTFRARDMLSICSKAFVRAVSVSSNSEDEEKRAEESVRENRFSADETHCAEAPPSPYLDLPAGQRVAWTLVVPSRCEP